MNASVCPPGDQASAGRPPAGSMLSTLPVVISSAGDVSIVRRTAELQPAGAATQSHRHEPSGQCNDADDRSRHQPRHRFRWPRTCSGYVIGSRRRKRVLQLEPHIGDMVQPFPGILGQAARDQTTDGRWCRCGQSRATQALWPALRQHIRHLIAANGRRPASISNSTQPKAQMSARWSTGLPRACSGLM